MSSPFDIPPVLPEHLYVHVPLCRSKCSYCDFYSVTPDTLQESPAFLAQLLCDQASGWLDRGPEARPLETLYVGGGTPTMLGRALPALVRLIASAFGLRQDAEITVEANPETVDPDLLDELREAGVTRVSLGAQSFDDEELRLLGRAHDAERAYSAARQVHEAGLSLSLDLMCGLPAQTQDSWARTLVRATDLDPEHVSVYPLSLEAGSPLAAAVLIGDVEEPESDVTADEMLLAAHVLENAGLVRYEVANYARPSHASRHNTAYWTGAEYLGVGPAAHGMLSVATAAAAGFVALPADAARLRYSIASDLGDGLSRAPRADVEVLDAAQADREDAMLGMRLVAGVDDALAERAGVVSALQALEADGLVVHAFGRWSTTERGWLLGNEVFGRIWNTDSV